MVEAAIYVASLLCVVKQRQYSMLTRGDACRPCTVVILVLPPYKRVRAVVTYNLSLPPRFPLVRHPHFQLELYSKQFASANQLGPEIPAASALQDACSLAYALQVAAR